MKKTAFALCLFLAASASAATLWFDAPNHGISWIRPDVATHPATKQSFGNPSDATLSACGWTWLEYEDCPLDERLWGWEPEPWVRRMTQEERDARDAEAEAAEAQAEALKGPDPEVKVPVLDDAGNAIGTARLVVRASQWVLMPLTNSMSPQRHWVEQQAEFTGRSVEMDTTKDRIKAAKSKGNGTPAVLGRLSALEAAFGVR